MKDKKEAIDDLIARCQEFESAIIWTKECLCCLKPPDKVIPLILMVPFTFEERSYSSICLFSCPECAVVKNKEIFYQNLTEALEKGTVEVMN